MIEFHEDDNWWSTRVLEGRALRARSEPDWRARRRRAPPSTLPVVPLENIEFPLVRPVFDTRDIAMTYRIVSRIAISLRTILRGATRGPKIRAAKLEPASGSSIRVSHDFSNTRSISSAVELEKYSVRKTNGCDLA